MDQSTTQGQYASILAGLRYDQPENNSSASWHALFKYKDILRQYLQQLKRVVIKDGTAQSSTGELIFERFLMKFLEDSCAVFMSHHYTRLSRVHKKLAKHCWELLLDIAKEMATAPAKKTKKKTGNRWPSDITSLPFDDALRAMIGPCHEIRHRDDLLAAGYARPFFCGDEVALLDATAHIQRFLTVYPNASTAKNAKPILQFLSDHDELSRVHCERLWRVITAPMLDDAHTNALALSKAVRPIVEELEAKRPIVLAETFDNIALPPPTESFLHGRCCGRCGRMQKWLRTMLQLKNTDLSCSDLYVLGDVDADTHNGISVLPLLTYDSQRKKVVSAYVRRRVEKEIDEFSLLGRRFLLNVDGIATRIINKPSSGYNYSGGDRRKHNCDYISLFAKGLQSGKTNVRVGTAALIARTCETISEWDDIDLADLQRAFEVLSTAKWIDEAAVITTTICASLDRYRYAGEQKRREIAVWFMRQNVLRLLIGPRREIWDSDALLVAGFVHGRTRHTETSHIPREVVNLIQQFLTVYPSATTAKNATKAIQRVMGVMGEKNKGILLEKVKRVMGDKDTPHEARDVLQDLLNSAKPRRRRCCPRCGR